MKIGILSLPLGRNYGGVLQQYALKTFLESQGNHVVILNRQPNEGNFLKQSVRKILKSAGVRRFNISPRQEPNLRPFIQHEFQLSSPVSSSRSFKQLCKSENLDAIVYGSDQVWRREFEIHYGLDFFGVSTPSTIKQVAYAPSFGLDSWEYSPRETAIIIRSLARFAAVSSREESGVNLIREYLHHDAPLVCDPTMLLLENDYSKNASKPLRSRPYCFVYWLGDEESMNNAIEGCSRIQGLDVVSINLRTTYPLPSIEDWLSDIANADYIITDSFHGTVFSLLFHKQFYIHCNKSGGISRLETLLKRVGADGKLSEPAEDVDYSLVNPQVQEFRNQSIAFLTQALSK